MTGFEEIAPSTGTISGYGSSASTICGGELAYIRVRKGHRKGHASQHDRMEMYLLRLSFRMSI